MGGGGGGGGGGKKGGGGGGGRIVTKIGHRVSEMASPAF